MATVDLLRGVPNRIGPCVVFVTGAGSASVRLAVSTPDGEVPSADYHLGDVVVLAGERWQVVEIPALPPLEPKSPPGTGSGDVVARIHPDEPAHEPDDLNPAATAADLRSDRQHRSHDRQGPVDDR